MSSVIVIGAGAAGLNAAHLLSKAGRQVRILEARNRIGGRIHTIDQKPFTSPVELGAEFIHGALPRTQALAREAGVALREDGGRQYTVEAGRRLEGESFDEGWSQVIEKLHQLDADISIAEFLNKNFSGSKYDQLRESITRFVEGYDAADTTRASAIALREEWTNSDAMQGFHLVGGYGQIPDHLHSRCRELGVEVNLSVIVKEIFWTKGRIAVVSSDGKRFEADQLLITIPPAVLKTGSVSFFPPIPEHQRALQAIETGGVIKILVEFDEAHWENPRAEKFRQFPDAFFFFSDAFVPTWWSQRPSPVPLLTGWLSGPTAASLKLSDSQLVTEGIRSLSYIFDCEEEILREHIVATRVVNWLNDPFALGAYAYKTVDSERVVAVISKPVDDTIYFAGEAYYAGAEMGTVEAALASGEDAATAILTS